jgi:hypothetical protein
MQNKQTGNCNDLMDDPFKRSFSPSTARGTNIPIIVTKLLKNENAVPLSVINFVPDIIKDVMVSEKCDESIFKDTAIGSVMEHMRLKSNQSRRI